MSARVRRQCERWLPGRRLLAASISVGLIAGIAAALHLGCSSATAAGQRTLRDVEWFGTDSHLGLVMETQAPGGPVTSSLWTVAVASGRVRRIAIPGGWYDGTFYGLSGGSSEGILAWGFRDAPEGMRSPGVSKALLPGNIAVFEQGKPVERLPIPGSNVGPAVSPDGGQIAFVHMPGIPPPSGEEDGVEEEMAYGIWVWERESQKMRPVSHPDLGHSDGPPQWSPDGHTIAFVRTIFPTTLEEMPETSREFPRDLWVVGEDGSEGRQLTHFGDVEKRVCAWGPDGSSIVFLRRTQGAASAEDPPQRTLWSVSVPTGQAEEVLSWDKLHQPKGWGAMRLPPDGGRVATKRYSPGGVATGLWLISIDSGEARELPVEGQIGDVAWSADASSLAYVVDEKEVWVAAGDADPRCVWRVE